MRSCVPLLLVLLTVQTANTQDTTECRQSNQFNKLLEHENNIFIAGTACICKATLELHIQRCAEIDLGEIKVLLPFEQTQIIMCGTKENGTCQIRKMDELYSVKPYLLSPTATNKTSTRVVSDDPSFRTVAFVGMAGENNDTVLYTASRQRHDANDNVLLSVRALKKNPFELYNQNGLGSQIELTWNETIRDKYYDLFDPIGGFVDDGWAYFFANQYDDYEKPAAAKLIRICQHDQGNDRLLSYQDIMISCMTITRLVDILYVPTGTRSRTKHHEDHRFLGIFQNGTHNSVCTYPFSQPTKYLDVAERRTDSTYLETSPESVNDERFKGNRGKCNNKFEYRNFIAYPTYRLNGIKGVTFEDNITHSTVSLINGDRHTLVLVSYDNQYISKIFIGEKDPYKLEPPIRVSVGNIRALKVIDDHVIVLNSTGMTKYPLYNLTRCHSFTTIDTCLGQNDPFCGWCTDTHECAILNNCSSSWIPIILGDLEIKSFFPTLGPMAGGSKLSFTGEHLFAFEIFIGDQMCTDINRINETVFECFTPASSEVKLVNVSYTYTLDNITRSRVLSQQFSYMENPSVSGISPNRTFESGGRNLTVTGQNFEIIQNPRLQIIGANISEGCHHSNNSVIVCRSPEATTELKERLEKEIETASEGRGSPEDDSIKVCGNEDTFCVPVEFQMDGVNTSLLRQIIEYARDPVFHNFTEEDMTKDYHRNMRNIAIMGDRINVAASVLDFSVTVGLESCQVVTDNFSRYQLRCVPPPEEPQRLTLASLNPEVQVSVGNIKRHVGFLRYHKDPDHTIYLYIGLGLLFVVIVTLVLFGTLLWHRSRHVVKKLQNDMELMEVKIQTQFRQAFADLQTDMTDITGELVETGLPYHEFPVYAFQILFPADDVTTMTSHKIFNYPETSQDVTDVDTAMMELEDLFKNKFFVLSVISTLEQQRKLSMSEKSSFAAFLATALLADLNYFSQLIKLLLEQQITSAVTKKRHKSLFRRCESITEKLTSLWLELALHQHVLKSRGGSSLIMMVKAIQTVMMKSPIDAVTDAARATLSYEQLLLCSVDNDDVIRLTVQINGGEHECRCSVLASDTIVQVKSKCLGVIYKKDPFSSRPKVEDIHLQWHCGKQGRLILEERDTKPSEDNCVKLMTLADYHVTDGALMELLNKKYYLDLECTYENLDSIQNRLSNSEVRPLVEEDYSETMDTETEVKTETMYHLIKPESENQEKGKMFAEVNLHKLLQTKLNVKQYVDEALDSALDRKDIPSVVKFIFFVLDELASGLGVDNDTLLSWKNNCYPIRFWGLLMSRPKIVFDIDVPGYLQPSLDIVASTFLDSFSPPQTLSKNSAPHKLLFYKDQEDYRQWVKSFHRAVTNTPSLDEREFAQHMNELSGNQKFAVKRTSVLYEIYKLLLKFKVDIVDGLEEDKDASRLGLPEKLEHVFEMMDNS